MIANAATTVFVLLILALFLYAVNLLDRRATDRDRPFLGLLAGYAFVAVLLWSLVFACHIYRWLS